MLGVLHIGRRASLVHISKVSTARQQKLHKTHTPAADWGRMLAAPSPLDAADAS